MGPADLDVAHCSTALALLHGEAYGLGFRERYEAHGGRRLADGADHLYWRLLDTLAYSPDAEKLAAPWHELGRTDLTREVLARGWRLMWAGCCGGTASFGAGRSHESAHTVSWRRSRRRRHGWERGWGGRGHAALPDPAGAGVVVRRAGDGAGAAPFSHDARAGHPVEDAVPGAGSQRSARDLSGCT